MDPEQPSVAALLAPTPENLASVKVFPLIPALKKDITVSTGFRSLDRVVLQLNLPFLENNW